MASPNASVWQQSLNPKLVQRLNRPFMHSGVSPDQMGKVILDRTTALQGRLPLLEQQMQRWSTVVDLETPSIPIVYAQPGASGRPEEHQESSSEEITLDAIHSPLRPVVQAEWKQVAVQPEVVSLAVMAIAQARNSDQQDTSVYSARSPLQRPELVAQPVTVPIVRVRSSDLIRVPDAQQATPAQASPAFANHSQQDHAISHSQRSLSPEIVPVKASSFTGSQSASPQTASPQTASPQTASPQTASLQPQLPDSSVPRSFLLLPGVENPATPGFFMPPIAIPSIQDGGNPQIQRKFDPSNFSSIESVLEPSSPIILKSQPAPSFAENQFAENQFAENQFAENHQVLTPVSLASMLPLTVPLVMPETLGTEKRWPTLDIVATRPTGSDSNLAPVIPNQSSVGQSSNQQHQASPQDKHTPRNKKASAQDSVRSTPARSQPVRSQPARSHPKGFAPQTQSGKKSPRSKKRTDAQQTASVLPHSPSSLSPEIIPVKVSSFTSSQSASPQPASPQPASLQPQLPDSSVPRSLPLLPGVENPATPVFFIPPIAIASIQNGDSPQIQRRIDPSANQPLIFQTQHLQAQHLQAQHLQAQHLQAQHLQAHTEVTDTEPSPSRSIYGVHTSPLRPLNPPMLGDFQTLNPTDIHGFASEFDLWDLNLRDRQNRFGSPLYLRNHIPGYDISSVATLLLPQVSAQSQQPASTLLNIQPLPLLSPEPVTFIHQIAPITNSISRTQPLSVIKPDSPINSLQHEWVSFEDKKITVEFVSPEFKPLTFVNLEYTTPTLINPESEDPEYSTFTFVNPKSQNLEYTTPPFVNLESQNPEYTSPELANLEYISLPKPVQSLDVLTPPTHRVQMSVEQAQQQPSQSLLTLSTPSKAVENRSELGTTPSQLPLIQVETEIAPPSFEPLLLSVPNQGKPQAYPVQQQLSTSTSTSTSRTTSTSHSASHSASRSSSVHSPGASSAGQMASSYPIGTPLSTSPKPSQLHPVFQAGGVSNSPPAIDIDAIAEQVERKLMKRLVVESERRGKRKWH